MKSLKKSKNASISAIFETKGEIYFRKLEHEVLKEFYTNKNQFVLSLGGGTPCYSNNHEFLQQEGYCFYLSQKRQLIISV